MAAAASFFSQSVGTIHVCGCANSSGFCFGKSSSRSISNGFPIHVRLLGKRICSSSHCKLHVVRESNSCALMMDRVSSSSDSSIDNNGKRSIESALILIRHGESLWNEKNLFTGCVDVPLTKKGIEEALQAGIRISNIPIDVVYTSTLIRAQMTAMLAMTQHRHKKDRLSNKVTEEEMGGTRNFMKKWEKFKEKGDKFDRNRGGAKKTYSNKKTGIGNLYSD